MPASANAPDGTSGGGAPMPGGTPPGTAPDPGPTPGGTPTPTPDPTPTPTPAPAPGELTWTVERAAGGDPLMAVWGTGAGEVWAVGGKTILRSGGDGRWATLAGGGADESYAAVYGADGWVFVGGSTCPAGLCESGVLLRSNDGGASWTRATVGTGVTGLADAGGVVYATSGDLYASRDHFATTQTIAVGWAAAIGAYAGEAALFSYGGLRGSTIRRSTDGGQNWATVYEGFSGSQSGHVDGMAAGASALYAIANGCSVPACQGALFRSEDGGATWSERARIADSARGIVAFGDGELWVGGARLVRSRDGGASFGEVKLPVTTTISAIWGPSADELWAVSVDGTILHGKR